MSPSEYLQKVFNTVWEHLHQQGQASGDREGDCYYRHPGNSKYKAGVLKCAVGCLIKDEFYNVDLERQGVTKQAVQDALTKSGVHLTGELLDLLTALQSAHDVILASRPPETKAQVFDRWRLRMAKIAEKYGLTVPPVPSGT